MAPGLASFTSVSRILDVCLCTRRRAPEGRVSLLHRPGSSTAQGAAWSTSSLGLLFRGPIPSSPHLTQTSCHFFKEAFPDSQGTPSPSFLSALSTRNTPSAAYTEPRGDWTCPGSAASLACPRLACQAPAPGNGLKATSSNPHSKAIPGNKGQAGLSRGWKRQGPPLCSSHSLEGCPGSSWTVQSPARPWSGRSAPSPTKQLSPTPTKSWVKSGPGHSGPTLGPGSPGASHPLPLGLGEPKQLGLETERLKFTPWCPTPVCLGPTCLTSLSYNFLIYKMGVMTPTPYRYCKKKELLVVSSSLTGGD